MKFGVENIEEWMFEYFEGNLSDKDKADLLNYISLHPELEKDFSQWAQTYLLRKEEISDYGLTTDLLQKSAPKFGVRTIIASCVVVAIILASAAWWWGDSESNNKTGETFSRKTESERKVVNNTEKIVANKKLENIAPVKFKKESIQPSATMPETMKSDVNNNGIVLPKAIKIDEETVLKNEQENKPLQVKPEEQIKTEIPIPKEVVFKPDTLLNVPVPEKVVVPKTKQAANKKKAPAINLKPDSDFLPVNPNF